MVGVRRMGVVRRPGRTKSCCEVGCWYGPRRGTGDTKKFVVPSMSMAGHDKDDCDRSRLITEGKKGNCGETVVERGEIDRIAGDVVGSRDGNGGIGVFGISEKRGDGGLDGDFVND